jgi:hypothetical protein
VVVPLSRRLSATGIGFLGILRPSKDQLPLRSAHPTKSDGGDWTGFPRSARMRYNRGGCPLYSGTAVLAQPAEARPLPPAASQRPVLCPGAVFHLRGHR